MDDSDFLRDVETGTARFLERPPAPTPAPPALSTFVRPLGMRLDDRLGTSPLIELILGRPTHGRWQQLQAVVTVVGWITRWSARAVMRLRRASWKRDRRALH
tara:strand:- start:3465 stop:3770 length:306 start_codon:yes stop_codon:yes gene_type:complete